MELKLDELQGLTPALERIAAALEALAGNPPVSAKPVKTEPVTDSVDADPREETQEKPKKKKAAPKKSADSGELNENVMRKFAAEAVKKGLKTTAKIIKEITGGETRFADIDPELYAEIYQAISTELAKLEADE